MAGKCFGPAFGPALSLSQCSRGLSKGPIPCRSRGHSPQDKQKAFPNEVSRSFIKFFFFTDPTLHLKHRKKIPVIPEPPIYTPAILM